MTDKVNKSEEVRKYLSSNPGAKPSAVVAALKEDGVDVSSALVSAIKSKSKSRAAKKGSGSKNRPVVSDAVITDIFTVLGLIETANVQGVTVDEFVGSLDLTWETLENIKTVKEIKDLKERKSYGSLVDKYGKTGVINLVGRVKEIGKIK